MSGDLLALGVAGLLVAASRARARGSRQQEGRWPTPDPDRTPLPVDWRTDVASEIRGRPYREGWDASHYTWGGWSRGYDAGGEFRLVQWRVTVDGGGRYTVAAFESNPMVRHVLLTDDRPRGGWSQGLEAAVRAVQQYLPEFSGPPAAVRSSEQTQAQWDRAREQQRRRDRQGTRIAGQGYYPELLQSTEQIRGWCVDRDDITVEHDNGRIQHRSCDNKLRHHIQVVEGGEVVAGITLKAKKPWRGLQTATIGTIFVDPGRRREGLGTELLNYARDYFRRVHHSRDLTDAGAAWKRAVERR